MRLPFALQSYPADNPAVSLERLVNVFAEKQPDNAASPVVLRTTPGIVSYASPSVSGPVVALAVQRTELFAVAAGRVFRLSGSTPINNWLIEAGNWIATTVAASAAQVAFCCPPHVYVFRNSDNAFVRLQTFSDTGTAVPGFGSVTFVDGLFIFGSLEPGGAFYFSRAGDALDVRSVDFKTTESNPDNIVRVADLAGEIWCFGFASIEVWNAVGGAEALSRQLGAAMARGLGSFRSLAVADNSFFFMGDDTRVYRTRGYQLEAVSTFAIEREFLRYGDWSTAAAVVTNYAGHEQYRLNFASGHTWVFDLQSGLWHEEWTGLGEARHRIESAVRYDNRQLVGDLSSGNIGALTRATGAQFGGAMRRTFTLPPIYRENRRLFAARLELEADQFGPEAAGAVLMRYSDNGGRAWAPDRIGILGGANRMMWHRLGSFRERSFAFQMDGSDQQVFLGVTLAVQEGAH